MLLPLNADVSTWADTAMSMIGDRETYERFAWQAYDVFHQRFSWGYAVKRFEEAFYESVGLRPEGT